MSVWFTMVDALMAVTTLKEDSIATAQKAMHL